MDVDFSRKEDLAVLDSVRKIIVITYDLIENYPAAADDLKNILGACLKHGIRKVMEGKKLKSSAKTQAKIDAAVNYLESINLKTVNYSVALITLGYFLNFDEKEAFARVKPYLVDRQHLKKKEYMMLGAVIEMFTQLARTYSTDPSVTNARQRDINASNLAKKVINKYKSHITPLAPFNEREFKDLSRKFKLSPDMSFCTLILEVAKGVDFTTALNTPMVVGPAMLSVMDDFYSFMDTDALSTSTPQKPTVTFSDPLPIDPTMNAGVKKRPSLLQAEEEKKKWEEWKHQQYLEQQEQHENAKRHQEFLRRQEEEEKEEKEENERIQNWKKRTEDIFRSQMEEKEAQERVLKAAADLAKLREKEAE